MFKTSELASLLGVDRSFLHYYDKAGIILPYKNENQYRQYSETDLIALASAKYYRAMEMNLNSVRSIIHSSGYEEKIQEMDSIQNELKYQIDYLRDVYTVTNYAKSIYEIAYYQPECHEVNIMPFEYLTTLKNGKIEYETINDIAVQELLNSFPFVSYVYYFPENTITSVDNFSYELGLSIITELADKRKIKRPSNVIKKNEGNCIQFCITKYVNSNNFDYEDFEFIRQYAKNNNIELTGEAIAYCVFTNYDYEKGKIKFVVQNFTK